MAKDAPRGIEPGEDAVDAIALAISNGFLSAAPAKKVAALKVGASPPVLGTRGGDAAEADHGDAEEGPQEYFS
jgi:hypothetical protein